MPDADLWSPNDELANWIIEEVRDIASSVQVVAASSGSRSASPGERIMVLSASIERSFREFVEVTLREAYGDGDICWCDAPWWFKGFKDDARIEMLKVREQRSSGGSPTESATIGVLKESILSKRNWGYFESALTDAGFEDKNDFSERADHVNRLRNDTMHAQRSPDDYTDDEVGAVEEFAALLEEALDSAR